MIADYLKQEIQYRVNRIAELLKRNEYDAMLVTSNVNLYYTSGRVFSGYAYITADGEVTYFVKRPVGLNGDNVKYVRKPEQITELLNAMPSKVALELDSLCVNDFRRLSKVFEGCEIVDASMILRYLRSVKTEYEISKMKECGVLHDEAYHHIKE